ncbi:hypothetical protein OAH07_02705 [Verrucomicrobia bacterium]|nr:hypothetical protein [Verrucomicrobiota bacterium]
MKPDYKLPDDEWQFWRIEPAEIKAAWYHEIKRELTRYQNDIEDYPKCDIDPPWLCLSADNPLKIIKLSSTEPDPLKMWPDWMAFPEKSLTHLSSQPFNAADQNYLIVRDRFTHCLHMKTESKLELFEIDWGSSQTGIINDFKDWLKDKHLKKFQRKNRYKCAGAMVRLAVYRMKQASCSGADCVQKCSNFSDLFSGPTHETNVNNYHQHIKTMLKFLTEGT